jgi:hypothetical protein
MSVRVLLLVVGFVGSILGSLVSYGRLTAFAYDQAKTHSKPLPQSTVGMVGLGAFARGGMFWFLVFLVSQLIGGVVLVVAFGLV